MSSILSSIGQRLITTADLDRRITDLSQATTRRGDQVSLTGKNATIAATPILTAARNGIYRVALIVQVTTADAVSVATVTGTVGWTDRVGATTASTGAVAVAATGRGYLDQILQVQGDTNVTYAVTVTGAILTALFALEVRLERIG